MTALPGSVAEIAASPKGPSVGAFFDFDGTLMAGFSASHLSKARFRARDVSFREIVSTLAFGVRAGTGRAGFEDMMQIGADAWKGRAHADLEAMGERLFEDALSDLMYPEMRALVVAHLERGHTVVLSSSATEYQVDAVARYLGIDHVLCNRYVKADGVLTGELAGIVDIAVLPPVPVDSWSIETLDEHIAEVRQQFLDTLGDWPT